MLKEKPRILLDLSYTKAIEIWIARPETFNFNYKDVTWKYTFKSSISSSLNVDDTRVKKQARKIALAETLFQN